MRVSSAVKQPVTWLLIAWLLPDYSLKESPCYQRVYFGTRNDHLPRGSMGGQGELQYTVHPILSQTASLGRWI